MSTECIAIKKSIAPLSCIRCATGIKCFLTKKNQTNAYAHNYNNNKYETNW